MSSGSVWSCNSVPISEKIFLRLFKARTNANHMLSIFFNIYLWTKCGTFLFLQKSPSYSIVGENIACLKSPHQSASPHRSPFVLRCSLAFPTSGSTGTLTAPLGVWCCSFHISVNTEVNRKQTFPALIALSTVRAHTEPWRTDFQKD